MHEHWYWNEEPRKPGPSVVFDMDGVLSNAANRQHYLTQREPDWVGFFEACGDDELIEGTSHLMDVIDPSVVVVLMTARPLSVQPQTLAWLDRYNLSWDLLVMRPGSDYVQSRVFKRTGIYELREYGFDIQLTLEDDPRNVEMFREEGVPTLYIHSGYYDRLAL